MFLELANAEPFAKPKNTLDFPKIHRAPLPLCAYPEDELASLFGVSLPQASMGVSSDYLQAIQEGATPLPIG